MIIKGLLVAAAIKVPRTHEQLPKFVLTSTITGSPHSGNVKTSNLSPRESLCAGNGANRGGVTSFDIAGAILAGDSVMRR